MRHDAHGWWIADAGPPPQLPPLAGDTSADVVVVGGGYTGLWAAWHLAETGASVAVVEAGRCGFGPSGRNGGFVSSLALNRPSLAERHGAEAAARAVALSEESVRAIGAWCEAEGVDAWYRAAPHWEASAAPAQDGVGREAADGSEVVELSGEEVRRRCGSPVLRGAVEVRTGATVHPARLAFGLRDRLAARGVRIYEGSRVHTLRPNSGGSPAEVVAETSSGRVRAAAALVAINAATGALAPLRRRLTVASSHIVLTEPVPDVIEELGWTGGEAISDGRALLHYTRTTRDGRILFGWAGGRMACGARTGGRMEVDAEVVAQTHKDLVRFFPALAGRAIEHAWGGPIDVSPSHLPTIAPLPGGRVWAAYGYTGNGVGPSHLLGRAMAALALDRRDDPAAHLALIEAEPPTVPPEPFRVAGAALIRRALIRKEAAEEAGERADPLTRAVAALPGLMGVHIVR